MAFGEDNTQQQQQKTIRQDITRNIFFSTKANVLEWLVTWIVWCYLKCHSSYLWHLIRLAMY